VTWTKLGDEYGIEARDLTDAEFRTHTEALVWSNYRLLDLHIPKRDVMRFAESAAAADAVEGLAVKGWWEDRGDSWYIGLRFADWQEERADHERRQAAAALRAKRYRKHRLGDHSLCTPRRCREAKAVTRDATHDATRDSMRDVTPPRPDPSVRNGSGTHSKAAALTRVRAAPPPAATLCRRCGGQHDRQDCQA
jgi:hypothetical protein